MYIETVPNRNSRPAVLLRQGWREGKRVREKTLANLTDWPAEKALGRDGGGQCFGRLHCDLSDLA